MMEGLQPGDPQRAGSYQLIGRLGSGGMGQVFLGRSAGGRPVAVKVIRADLAGNQDFRVRFRREVAAAREVSGLFTALVVDADLDGPVPWLATAYVAGPSLADAVAGHGPLPAGTVLALAAGLAEGLNAIHAVGLVHRDLKPSNVLLADDGPRVIDFGISRAAEASVLTHTGVVVGSPGFMSPEQAEGGEVGPPSDIFSLGAVLTFAATGDGPFGTGSTAALIYRVVHAPPGLEGLPARVRPLVERCLAKRPSDRPTAGELLEELGGAELSADWLPEQIIQDLPRYAARDQARSAGADAGGSPGWGATESAVSPGTPAGNSGGPPTAAPGPAAQRPGQVSGPSPRVGPVRNRKRRLALTWGAGGFLAAAAAVVALVGIVGWPHSQGQVRQGPTASPTAPSPHATASKSGGQSSGPARSVSVSPFVATTVPVGSTPLSAAVTPDGRHVYIVNAGSSNVSVIDTASNTVTATIPVPGAGRVAISPDGRYAYVTACPNSCNNVQGDVSVIDTATNTVTAILTVGSGPFGVAISPDGRYAYVTDRNSEAVSVIDTASRTVTATVPVGVFPTSVAVSPDGREVYVTNATSNTVSVIDTASNTVSATIPAGAGADFSVAVAPDGRYAYVTDLAGTVYVIDTGSNTVITTVSVGAHSFAVAFTPDGRYAYVTDAESNTVSVISTASNVVIATFPAVNPDGVAFTPDGLHAYVTDRTAATVSVVNTGTDR
jgi:YVTN family beta-propeller protein